MVQPNLPKKYAQYSSLGFNLMAGMIFFSCVGYWIDQKRGGTQGWTLTGMFLGLFYGGYEVWKFIKKLNENNNDPDQEE